MKYVQTLKGQSDIERHVLVISNNKYIISRSHDTTVKVWDFEMFTVLSEFKHTKSIILLCLLGNDKFIAGDLDVNIIIWTL